MKYLVTGGAGFIGSHISRTLLENGNKVRILDNFSSGKRENLKGQDVEIIEGDLRDASRVADAVKGMDIVFHEAAFVSVPESMEKPQECLIVAIGPGRLDEDGKKRVEMEVKLGDKVIFAKYSGSEIKLADKKYLLMSEKDILAVVEK